MRNQQQLRVARAAGLVVLKAHHVVGRIKNFHCFLGSGRAIRYTPLPMRNAIGMRGATAIPAARVQHWLHIQT